MRGSSNDIQLIFFGKANCEAAADLPIGVPIKIAMKTGDLRVVGRTITMRHSTPVRSFSVRQMLSKGGRTALMA